VFEIRTKNWNDIKELRENIEDADEFLEIYNLKKTRYGIEQRNSSQPFFYFPHKNEPEDDGYFSLVMETGSHVAPCDTLYALHFYYFTLGFRNYFAEQLRSFETGYRLDGEDELRTDQWIRAEIFGTGDSM
jgi:hypothetical protein